MSLTTTEQRMWSSSTTAPKIKNDTEVGLKFNIPATKELEIILLTD